MKSLLNKNCRNYYAVITMLMLVSTACATISGITGTEFNFTVKQGFITTPDGGAYCMWGYSDDAGDGLMQYPGPTLIVNEGDEVTINLTNEICQPVSMVFPGQENVTALGGIFGEITNEAPPDGVTVCTYTFTAGNPGTYIYNSGTRQELQIEMGLVGTIIVRPEEFPDSSWAYGHDSSAYDREYLFLHTEMDPVVHQLAEMGRVDEFDNTTYNPVYWFLNGRCFPDTVLAAPNTELLPYQPYNALARMHPGEKILMRMVGAGRDGHPFHPHSNNFTNIARDGRLLESDPGVSGADLAYSDYTLNIYPGTTVDAIFEWTGEKLGWDIYGHAPGDPMQPNEYAPDHGKPIPVTLPAQKDLTTGDLYSGSPFLGGDAPLPPGNGAWNFTNGYWQIWHSHHEKEVCNNDIFPGGQITFMLIDHPDIPIP